MTGIACNAKVASVSNAEMRGPPCNSLMFKLLNIVV